MITLSTRRFIYVLAREIIKKIHIKINKNHTFKLANRHNSLQKKQKKKQKKKMKPLMKLSAVLHTCEAIFFWLRLLMWDDIGAKWRRCHSSVLISDARLWYEWRQGQRRQIGERIPMIFFCFTKLPCQDASLVPSSFPLHRPAHSYSPTPYIKQCINAKQLNCHWTWTQLVTNESSVFVFMV